MKNNIEPLTINDDEMKTIVVLAKAIRKYSENKSVSDLMNELKLIDICYTENNNHRHEILWNEPMLSLIKNIEKKFTKRLRQLKKEGLI